jgi:hypothetical protein
VRQGRHQQRIILLYMEKGKKFYVHQRILSAVKRVQYVTVWMSYILLTGSWCDTGLNAHTPI